MHKISYPKEGENLIDSLLLVHTNTFFWSSNVYKLEIEEIDGKSTAKARVLKNFPQKNWLKRQLFGRRYVKAVSYTHLDVYKRQVIHEAFHIATSGRPGPVVIDVPKDIQFKKTTYKGCLLYTSRCV